MVTTSWDDGHRLDSRLAGLLAKHGVAGTFYIAPRNVELAPADRLSPAAIRELGERFEIGGHTLTHQRLPRLSDRAAGAEMRAGKEELEAIVGVQVTSFCYPRGEYAAAHIEFARKIGFTCARTVRRNSLFPGAPLEMGTTVHTYAHRVDGPIALRLARLRPRRALKLALQWDELALRWFELCLEQGGVFHIWGHSWEIDARRDWHRLERVLDHVAHRPDVEYLPNRALLGLTEP
ncbi:polysaccharide deacetylase family protein [Streptomyces sp. AS02]|uniref:polysaccharide deacetylase family protein n=1 Tax=Streptomyces sp. AS02 TaxID=2938946 RepID=UPI002020B749|nr:polysaccharide deacetylase family protein [Streptomyces sp. AS02]MCL8012092.1 polysaccharide deacetylase family protein [Streptomyces sp. AS02]